MKRCPNCMSEMTGGRCAVCDYPDTALEPVRNALTLGVLLDSRWEIGHALAVSYQSIGYIAWDTQTEQRVIITELFPRYVAERLGQTVRPKRNAEEFALAKRLYQHSRQVQGAKLITALAANGTSYRVHELTTAPELAYEAVDALLDMPILFRDEQNKPRMSVNALKIPPFPIERTWKPAPGLLKHKRKVRNTVLASVLSATLLLGGGAAATMYALQSFNVSFTVRSEVPLKIVTVRDDSGREVAFESAEQVDDVQTYAMNVRRGRYVVIAENEEGNREEQVLLVPEKPQEEALVVPTSAPTPTMVPRIVLAEGEWLFGMEDKVYCVSVEEAAPAVGELPEDRTLLPVRIVSDKSAVGRDDLAECMAGYTLLLRSKTYGSQVALTWREDAAAFTAEVGDYELLVQLDTLAAPVKLTDVTIAGEGAELSLDAAALVCYRDYSAKLEAADRLMASGKDAYLLDSAGQRVELSSGFDYLLLDKWAADYPDVYGRFALRQVCLTLAEGLNGSIAASIEGIAWNASTALQLKVSDGAYTVRLRIENGDAMEETILIAEDTTDGPAEMTVFASVVEEIASRWQGADGVRRILRLAGMTYLVDNETAKPISEEQLRLDAELYIHASEALAAMKENIRLVLDDYVKPDYVESISFDGIPLELPDTVSASRGVHRVKICMRDESLGEVQIFPKREFEYDVTVEADGIRQSRRGAVAGAVDLAQDIKLLNDVSGDALATYSAMQDSDKDVRWAIINEKRVSLGGATDEELDHFLQFVYWFDVGDEVVESQKTLYTVSFVPDERLNTLAADKTIATLSDIPLDDWRDPVQLLAGEYTLFTAVEGKVQPAQPFTVNEDGKVVECLVDFADDKYEGLLFSALNDKIHVLNNQWLTDATVQKKQAEFEVCLVDSFWLVDPALKNEKFQIKSGESEKCEPELASEIVYQTELVYAPSQRKTAEQESAGEELQIGHLKETYKIPFRGASDSRKYKLSLILGENDSIQLDTVSAIAGRQPVVIDSRLVLGKLCERDNVKPDDLEYIEVGDVCALWHDGDEGRKQLYDHEALYGRLLEDVKTISFTLNTAEEHEYELYVLPATRGEQGSESPLEMHPFTSDEMENTEKLLNVDIGPRVILMTNLYGMRLAIHDITVDAWYVTEDVWRNHFESDKTYRLVLHDMPESGVDEWEDPEA